MDFDTSSLTPLGGHSDSSTSSAPQGLDVSSLRPFGQDDHGASSEPAASPEPSSKATMGSVAKQAGLGLVTGLPNAAAGTMDLLEKGIMDSLTFSDPVTGENQFKALGRSLGLVGGEAPKADPYIPTTGQDLRNVGEWAQDKTGITIPEPQNKPERIARAVGEGAVQMAVPEAMLGKAGAISALTHGATVGGLSGGTAKAAEEAVPDKYKGLAALAGGIGGGLVGEAAASLPRAVASTAKAGADYVAPMTTSGQERLAGESLRDAATNPDDVLRAIDSEPRELVPGSASTTFQLTGDPGLGSLERSVAAKNPDMFQTLRGEQNAARLQALGDIQAEGHPEAVSSFFRSQLDDIDQSTKALQESAEQAARDRASGLGAGRSAEAIGEDIKGEVSPQIEAAGARARSVTQELGGGNPDVLGEQARTALQTRLDALKERERALWKAVDPEKNMQVVATPIKRAVTSVYGDMGPESKLGMAPIERSIAEVVDGYGQILPFQRLIDLRSAISQAMREVRSPLQPNQPAYARLTQLRGAVEDAISDSVAQKAAQEQQAVASGAMKPEETFFSRFQRDAQEFQSAKRSSERRAAEAYYDLGGSDAGRQDVSVRPMGEGSPPGGSSRGASSSEGSTGPFLDEGAAQRLKDASAATAERKQTFGAKPVSQILQRPGSTQPFTMPSAGVASSIWKTGNAGADSVRSVLSAAGNSPEAIEAVRNMASQSLRDKAADGIVTQKVLNQWRTQHQPALQALEQASPGTIARFDNAARAAEGLQRFEGFNPATPSSALPEKYFTTGDKGFAAVEDLRSLLGKEKADKLLGDYAASSLQKSAMLENGTIDPKKFEAWQKSHSGALRALPDVQAKFLDAAKATRNLEAAAAQRRDMLDAYQKSAAGKLLKVDDPADVVRTVGSIFGRKDAVSQMRELAKSAAQNPEAMEGLRRSIVDYMKSNLISNTEAGTTGKNLIKSDAFQSFLGKNYTTLRQVFSDEELGSMRAIAQDLKRANRSIASSKLPGGSNTAQDQAAIANYSTKESLLSKLATHVVGSGAGFLTNGPTGAALGFIGSNVIGAMRAKGLQSVDDLIRDAMLNPDLAKALLMKAPKRPDTGSALTLASRIRNLGAFSAANSVQQPKTPEDNDRQVRKGSRVFGNL